MMIVLIIGGAGLLGAVLVMYFIKRTQVGDALKLIQQQEKTIADEKTAHAGAVRRAVELAAEKKRFEDELSSLRSINAEAQSIRFELSKQLESRRVTMQLYEGMNDDELRAAFRAAPNSALRKAIEQMISQDAIECFNAASDVKLPASEKDWFLGGAAKLLNVIADMRKMTQEAVEEEAEAETAEKKS